MPSNLEPFVRFPPEEREQRAERGENGGPRRIDASRGIPHFAHPSSLNVPEETLCRSLSLAPGRWHSTRRRHCPPGHRIRLRMIVARIPDDVSSIRIEHVSITWSYLPLPADPPTIRERNAPTYARPCAIASNRESSFRRSRKYLVALIVVAYESVCTLAGIFQEYMGIFWTWVSRWWESLKILINNVTRRGALLYWSSFKGI